MTRQFSAFAALISFAFAGSALAVTTENTPGIVDAYEVGQSIREELRAGNLAEPTQRALNVLVEKGIALLVAQGDVRLADQLQDEWNANFQDRLSGNAIVDSEGTVIIGDLGDHDPLSPWLANLVQTLNAKSRGTIGGVKIISDLNTMNFALAVVLRPKSNTWKSGIAQNDEWQYRKHFIPMANIITYWVTLETCNAVVKKKLPKAGKVAKKLCPKAATKLEFYMGRYWAPKISDFVYEKANGIKKSADGYALIGEAEEFEISEAAFENAVMSRN